MKNNRLILLLIFCISCFTLNLSAKYLVQDDTVYVPLTEELPVFDGDTTDALWEKAEWQAIDQVWIEYGTNIPASDFKGRYKMLWSETDNLLYFFFQIYDDVLIDGYVYPNDGYPNYDIVEVFIDEDKSGGGHVFDSNDEWGLNAENAFSYHIMVDYPEENKTVSEKVVCDIAGTSWGDKHIPDYAEHLPDFAVKRIGNNTFWEFSLKVYGDGYDHSSPEASRVDLKAGKTIGLSAAYCDNDDGGDRDHFFGSVAVSEAAYNDHWRLADDYGTIKLMPKNGSANPTHSPVAAFETSITPLIDGTSDDVCWDSAIWYDIDQVWIPYNTAIDSNDYKGRFKASWSSENQLLYYLVEIRDDVFVTGYEYTASAGEYTNYDVVEVFVDPDNSGGEHTFNYNAFAYHITGGNNDELYEVIDIYGSEWSTNKINLTGHVPELARTENNNVYTWEFSMELYDESFSPLAPDESRVVMEIKDTIGFTMAVIDSDNPSNPQREHFIGSVAVSEENYNSHWQNASLFGDLILMEEKSTSTSTNLTQDQNIFITFNKVTNQFSVSAKRINVGEIRMETYTLTGQKVQEHLFHTRNQSNFITGISASGLENGIYMIRISWDNTIFTKKVVKY